MTTIGLVLGKFAPLHAGHQRLIETSLSETDQTLVLIYDCPDLDVPPLPVRVQWLRDLYPQVEIVEAWDGPTATGLEPQITEQHDNYLRRRLGNRGITHFFSSEPYGAHVSAALGAIDRRVDPQRSVIAISATAIRQDPFAHRHFLSPRVYRDLITKVVLLGAPSTGKTTLAEALAQRYQTLWMPEYGREYWELHQTERRLTLEQLYEIAVEHRRREEQRFHNANRYLFVDTDASTTLQFSYYYHDQALPQLIDLAVQTRQRYDLFLLCDTDIPYADTWDRSGAANRQEMQRRIWSDLVARKVPFHGVTGSLAARLEQATQVIQEHDRWRTLTAPRSGLY